MKVSPNTIIIFLLLFLVAFTIYYWKVNLDLYPEVEHYLTALFHLGVIVVILGFIFDRYTESDKQKSTEISQFKERRNSGFIQIDKIFIDNNNELFKMYQEMNTQDTSIQKIPPPSDYDLSKKIMLESIVSNLIFLRIEGIYLELTLIDNYQSLPEYTEWVNTWRQWFKSPILRHYWQYNKSNNFSPRIVNFIDQVLIQKIDN